MKINMHHKIISTFCFSIALAGFIHAQSTGNHIKISKINIDGNSPGRQFDGIGAVSAGASSRLLIDYPEPYRSDILDFLFKPNFGAGFTYLKVEIGGDGNSTCGSEPSFARTRDELTSPNYLRGYEYWLMREAQNRNEKIELDALEWCMPGWFTDQKVWSQDNADYIVGFLKGARDIWKLKMTHIAGSWNERNYDRNWIVNIHQPTLRRNGFSDIKIVGPDGCIDDIYDKLLVDTEFKNTICAVSEHYMVSYMFNDFNNPDTARIRKALESNVPLWSGEDFSLPGKPWNYVTYMAKNIIKCYLRQKTVKINLWCPVAAMADNSCFSNTGIMKAAEPWSGYYEVWPAIWGIAHFNQFAQPGWYYIDSGCGILEGDGVYATYKKPDNSGDYSIVIVNGSQPQKLDFHTSGLADHVLHVWKSDRTNQFVLEKDIIPVNGTFSITTDAESMYSITTTTGQKKGYYVVPPKQDFIAVYHEDFESYSLTEAPLTAKYIWDNSGSFEIFQSPGESKCLRQMVNNRLIGWIPDSCAQTFIAQGREWEDGEISSDVFAEENAFNGTGYAGIIIRGSYDKHLQSDIPHGYRLGIYHDGTWKLLTKDKILAEGTSTINAWHRLKLKTGGQNIKAYIDNNLVADINDPAYTMGAAGYVSGWNHAKFDNLEVRFEPVKGKLVSEWKEASASSAGSKTESPLQAFDGNSLSRWKAGSGDMPQWIKVDLGRPYDVVRMETFIDSAEKVNKYKIEYSLNDRKWDTYADRSNHSVARIPCFIDNGEAKARYVRLTIMETHGAIPCVFAFNVYAEED